MTRKVNLPFDSRFAGTKLFQIVTNPPKDLRSAQRAGQDATRLVTNNVRGSNDFTQGAKVVNSFVWGVWKPPNIPDSPDDVLHTVRRMDIGRLDSLAGAHYGNSNLDWVIAMKNGIVNPLIDMSVGQRLRIPARSNVTGTLSRVGSGVRQSRIISSDKEGLIT